MKKLITGMRSDEAMVDQLPGSWRHAQNIVTSKRNGSISNEEGVNDVTPTIGGAGTAAFPSTKKVVGEIKYQNERILFFVGSTPETSELGRIKEDGKYYPILRDAASKVVLNLDEDHPVIGVAAKKYNDNVIVSWTDANDNLCILNIDNLPFEIDGSYNVVVADVEKAQALIKLFPPFTDPIPEVVVTGSGVPNQSSEAVTVVEGGGSLTSGTYYPFMRYEFPDGTTTSPTKIYNGIPIPACSLGLTIDEIAGGEQGEATGKAIRMSLTNVDTNYRKIQIGYIYVSNGITTAYWEKSYRIGSDTVVVEITGSNRTQINLSEALTPNAVYKKAETMTALQNTLFLGGIEYDETFNFQEVANNTVVHWVYPLSGVEHYHDTAHLGQNNYANGRHSFLFKSFKTGECYAFYLRAKLTNGLYSKAFHIPGREAIAGDKDVMNPAGSIWDGLDGGADVYKYQVKNTHTVVNNTIMKGLMGYWENENEEYPLDPANPANVHPDYASIPGVTASDRKVRHHVFPDITSLSGTATKFVNESGVSGSKVVTTVPMGIEVLLNIPSNLIDQVESWEVLYAERNNTNIRMLGTDVATSGHGSTLARFNHFDLMANRPALVPSYIKPLCVWTGEAGATPNHNNLIEYLSVNTILTLADASLFHNVTAFNYVGADTTVPINNTGYADCMAMTVSPAIDANDRLYDICLFKRDVYVDFNNQNLISTGYTRLAVSGVDSMILFGGDVYVNRHSIQPTTTSGNIYHFVCESVSNIALRKEDLEQSKFFAPKSATPSDSWFGYDADYNSINKFNIVDTYYPEDDGFEDQTSFPNLIARSLPETTEGKYLNWRTFKANSYYTMPKDKGAITSLLGNDRIMYIHHELSLYIAEIKDSLRGASGEEIAALGVTDIFDRPPVEVNPIQSGMCGNQSKFATILCDMGYVFVDRQKGEVYVVNHGTYQAKRISDQGMSIFFRQYGQTTLTDVDNPFLDNGYTMAYDSLYERLIITKLDSTYAFTISYSPTLNEGQGGWIAFHTYRPNFISHNRLGLVAYENALHKVFEHNSSTVRGTFYDGAIKESLVDVVFNEAPEITKNFQNVNWITTIEQSGIIYEDETATHLVVYNATQCTDKIDLDRSQRAWYSRDAKNVEETWNFNNFRDLVINPALAFLDNRKELVTSNLSSTKSWYNKSKFLSKFVVLRLIYDNVGQKDFHLSYVGSNFKKSNR